MLLKQYKSHNKNLDEAEKKYEKENFKIQSLFALLGKMVLH
jgi:hypothetical protein